MAEDKKEGGGPPPKNKSKIVNTWEFYKDGKSTKRSCPKCGGGVFMAEHKDRLTCGKCGYTEFASKKEDKKEDNSKKEDKSKDSKKDDKKADKKPDKKESKPNKK